MKKSPHPVETSDVETFLGVMEYYRKFMAGLAGVAALLSGLTNKY